MKKKFIVVLVAVALSVVSSIGTARGYTIALQGVPTGTLMSWNSATIGWEFSTSVDLEITALGIYDYGSDGLRESHEVGIFNLSGTLLTSTTIPSGIGGTLTDSFRYTSHSYSLNSGTYVIGARYTSTGEVAVSDATATTFSTEITYIGNRYKSSGAFEYPTSNWLAQEEGFFGPNFQYDTSQPVPEPATIALLGIGLVGLAGGAVRRRFKRNKP